MANVAGRVLLIVAALVLAPKNVSADWQFTKWGTNWEMTPDQVLAASKGALQKCDKKACGRELWQNSQVQLYGTYEEGEFSFAAFVYFEKDTNKLRRISLELKQIEKKFALFNAIKNRYGWHHSEGSRKAFFVWRLPADEVTWVENGGWGPVDFVVIYYDPPNRKLTKRFPGQQPQ